MKFSVEIELDWINEESTLDSEIQDRIIRKLTEQIGAKFVDNSGKAIAQKADRLITAKTELLINTILEKPVTVSSGWNDKREYDSIYDMVESRMTGLYSGKLNNSGKCEKDPLLSRIEGYVDSHMEMLERQIEKKIKSHAEEYSQRSLNNSELMKAFKLTIGEK